jgi:hypothetical protein
MVVRCTPHSVSISGITSSVRYSPPGPHDYDNDSIMSYLDRIARDGQFGEFHELEEFLRALKRRGLRGVVLAVSDDHPGLKRAITGVLRRGLLAANRAAPVEISNDNVEP